VLLELQLEAQKYGDGKIPVYETTGDSQDGITQLQKKRKMDDLYDKLEEIHFGKDSTYFPGFLQKIGVDADEAFKIMRDGPWIDREVVDMRYRRNPLQRTKSFYMRYPVSEMAHVYSYTGFQWKSVLRYLCYKDFPLLDDMIRRFDGLGLKYNHIIATFYKNQSDNIGFHSDKTRSWVDKSSVAIISLGAERDFVLRRISDGVETVFKCKSGDMIVLGWEDNIENQHAVPPAKDACGERISLCFRDIEECYTRVELDKKIRAAEKSKDGREAKKARISAN